MISVASPQPGFAHRSSARPAYGPGEARLQRARQSALRRCRMTAAMGCAGLAVAALALVNLAASLALPIGRFAAKTRPAFATSQVVAIAVSIEDVELRAAPIAATSRPGRSIAVRFGEGAPGAFTGPQTGVSAGATQVPWVDRGNRFAEQIPSGLPLAAPFIKWGAPTDRLGVFCGFQDPAYPGHTGVDLQVDSGAPVFATLTGVVVWASENGAYGNLVVVEAGRYQAWYAHLSRIDVAVGDGLVHGAVLGLSGGQPGAVGAGSSGGPHLHYAIRLRGASAGNDLWLDPAHHLPSAELRDLGCSR